MFEKCITCNSIGERCVPNLWLLPFTDLIQWCIKRQKCLGWTNQMWADKANTPVGTVNRLKAGDTDCKYSTMRNLALALIGGTTDEWPCTQQVERELRQMEQLEESAAKVSVLEIENATLKERLSQIDEQHRKDIRVVKEEYQEQITFLKDELKAWRAWHQKQD